MTLPSANFPLKGLGQVAQTVKADALQGHQGGTDSRGAIPGSLLEEQ